jgi:3-hydroxy-9,10-secoandrosta-1,3,5(10)-triene-9,17-dione monooxygenase
MSPKRVPSLAQMLEQAEALGAEAETSALEAERNRKADDRTVGALVQSGLLKVMAPSRYGGYELGFPEFDRIGQALARHEVSLGWLYCIIGVHHWWGGYVDPQLQDEMWSKNPNTVFVDSFAPTGRAEPVRSGFRLNGRWSFLSGLPWAEWMAVGAMAPFEPAGPPEYLMFFLPKADYQVVDDWYTAGLRGSASASVEVRDAFIPQYRAFRLGLCRQTGLAPGQQVNPSALFKIPIVLGLGHALVSPSLGGTQAMGDRFRRNATSRMPLFQNQRQAELALSQTVLAECTLTLEATELMLYRLADEVMELGRAVRPLDSQTGLRHYAHNAYIARQARRVAGELAEMAGARSIFESDPMQRFWRDVHVMGQHVALNYEAAMRNYGRVLMGLESEHPMF